SNSTLTENTSAAKAADGFRPLHKPPTTEGANHDTAPRSSTHPVNRRRRRPAPPRHPLHHLPARCADRRHPNRTKHHARSPPGTHQQNPPRDHPRHRRRDRSTHPLLLRPPRLAAPRIQPRRRRRRRLLRRHGRPLRSPPRPRRDRHANALHHPHRRSEPLVRRRHIRHHRLQKVSHL